MAESGTRGADLRELRRRAGISQVELARRIGIPATVLSAYERGRREPRVDVFFRAVEAAGFEVEYAGPRHRRTTIELVVPDADEKSTILARVCAVGVALPRRERADLTFPTFRELAARRR